MIRSPRVLILGAKGMVGQTMCREFSAAFPKTVWGTDRHGGEFLRFDVADGEKSFASLIKKTGKIDFVINCIGVLRQREESEGLLLQYIAVNALFPHALVSLAHKHGFTLIHLSTDAVFSPTSGPVDERSPISPTDAYGMSKSLGEPHDPRALTIRSSIIGTDRFGHKGIVEWVLANRGKTIDGFTNQRWAGCTSIQLAQLCVKIVTSKQFDALKKRSAIYHFAPLKATKYQLVVAVRKALNDPAPVRRAKSEPITRQFKTRWKSLAPMAPFYKCTLDQAISQLNI